VERLETRLCAIPEKILHKLSQSMYRGESAFCLIIHFLFQTPHDSERVSTFAGADESALFHRLNGIAIGRQRTYFFTIFQPPQNGVAAERISFKLVAVLEVRK